MRIVMLYYYERFSDLDRDYFARSATVKGCGGNFKLVLLSSVVGWDFGLRFGCVLLFDRFGRLLLDVVAVVVAALVLESGVATGGSLTSSFLPSTVAGFKRRNVAADSGPESVMFGGAKKWRGVKILLFLFNDRPPYNVYSSRKDDFLKLLWMKRALNSIIRQTRKSV